MENENIQTLEESTANQVTSSDNTEESKVSIENKYFKAFESEDEYNKFFKSESMKRINSLYQELGVKSKDELKEALGYKQKFEELNNTHQSVMEEYNKYRQDNEAAIQEKDNLSKQLTLSKLGITDNEEQREDFIMAVEALASKKELSFEKAAEEFLFRHPEFKDVSFKNGIKIGSEKSNISEDLESGVEKAFKKMNPWYSK